MYLLVGDMLTVSCLECHLLLTIMTTRRVPLMKQTMVAIPEHVVSLAVLSSNSSGLFTGLVTQ